MPGTPDGTAKAIEEDEPSRLSAALITDLSSHRTMSLRDALASQHGIALFVVTQTKCQFGA
jgi:hypothetical protein